MKDLEDGFFFIKDFVSVSTSESAEFDLLYLFSSYQIPRELIEQPAVSFAHKAVKIGKSNIDALSYLISHFPRAKNHPCKV